MKNQRKNYIIHNVSKNNNKDNNFFHEVKASKINTTYTQNIHINTPQRVKTPIYIRVNKLINGENNNNNNVNYICTCKNKENFFTSPRSNINRDNYILYTMPNSNRKNELNNTNIINTDININNLRGSDYTNNSVSGMTSNSQFDNLNAKCNYYRNLYNQVKGHNVALLNEIKNSKNNKIIESLQKENQILKSENSLLKKFKNDLSNNNDEIDINKVLLKENYILKEEIKKLYESNSNNDNGENIIDTENLGKIRDDNDVLNNLVDNLNNKIKDLEKEKELIEQNYQNQLDELTQQKNNSLNNENDNLNEVIKEKDELINKIQEENDELKKTNEELNEKLNE